MTGPRSKLRPTKNIRSALFELFAAALFKNSVKDDPVAIAERFIEREFVGGDCDQRDSFRHAKKSSR